MSRETQQTSTASPTDAPVIFDTCVPRDDVVKGELAEEKFAADLGQVVYGSDDSIYGSAGEFFGKTYPTDGLKKVLGNLIDQIANRAGSSVIDLDTSFGGGKTHNLIAAYHFLTNPEAIAESGRFVDSADYEQYLQTLADRPVEVAAFVGTDVDALDASMAPDDSRLSTPNTIWGELAYRLEGATGYDEIREYDEQRIAPGKNSFGKVLDGSKHYIILLDELAEYLAKTQGVDAAAEDGLEQGDVDDLADSTLAFFKALLQYASTNNNLTVLYTIADTAFGDEAEAIRTTVDELGAIGKRKEWNITPTNDDEIAPVIANRLFETVDREAADTVASTYDTRFFDNSDSSVSGADGDDDYADRIQRFYPFHPATIDILTDKVDSLDRFQKTRGALRLLSRAVYQLWAAPPDEYDRHLIRPYDLTLADSEIRAEAQDLFEAVDLEAARTADIWNAEGNSHAQIEDRNRAADGLPALGSHLATTIFWHSLAFGTENTKRGVTFSDLQTAVAHPQVRFDKYSDSLDRLTYKGGLNTETACYFLHAENNLYRFSSQATPSQILADERDAVEPGEIRDEIEERISGLKQGHGGFEVHTPERPHELPDEGGNPKLAVMHYESLAVSAGDSPPKLLEEILQYNDDKGSHRTYKNNLVFILADSDKRRDAEDTVRKYLARKSVLETDEYEDVLSPEQFEEVRELKRKLLVNTAIKQIYRHLFYPDDDGLSHIFLKDIDVTDHDSFESMVLDAFTEPDTPVALDAGADGRAAFYTYSRFFSADVAIDTAELVDRFRRNTNVPLLLSIEPVKRTVVTCVQDDDDQFGFGYVDSSGRGYYDVTAAEQAGVDPADPDAYENLKRGSDLTRHDVEISEEAQLYADVEAFIEQVGEVATCGLESCDNRATSQYCEAHRTCDEPGCQRTLDRSDIGQYDKCDFHRTDTTPTCPAEGCDTEVEDGGFCHRHSSRVEEFTPSTDAKGVLRALNDLRDGLREDAFDHGVPVLNDLEIIFVGSSPWSDAYDFLDYLDDPFEGVDGESTFEYKYEEEGDISVSCTAKGDLAEMESSRPITRDNGRHQIALSVDIETDAVVGDDSLVDNLITLLNEKSDARGTIIARASAHNTPEGSV